MKPNLLKAAQDLKRYVCKPSQRDVVVWRRLPLGSDNDLFIERAARVFQQNWLY